MFDHFKLTLEYQYLMYRMFRSCSIISDLRFNLTNHNKSNLNNNNNNNNNILTNKNKRKLPWPVENEIEKLNCDSMNVHPNLIENYQCILETQHTKQENIIQSQIINNNNNNNNNNTINNNDYMHESRKIRLGLSNLNEHETTMPVRKKRKIEICDTIVHTTNIINGNIININNNNNNNNNTHNIVSSFHKQNNITHSYNYGLSLSLYVFFWDLFTFVLLGLCFYTVVFAVICGCLCVGAIANHK